MIAIAEREELAANDPVADPARTSPTSAIADVGDLIGAWTRLVEREMVLARHSLGWILIGAVAVPVIAMGSWVSLSVVLILLAQVYTGSWILAALFGAAAQFLALTMLLRRMRRWMHDLALPNSRAALARAMGRVP